MVKPTIGTRQACERSPPPSLPLPLFSEKLWVNYNIGQTVNKKHTPLQLPADTTLSKSVIGAHTHLRMG